VAAGSSASYAAHGQLNLKQHVSQKGATKVLKPHMTQSQVVLNMSMLMKQQHIRHVLEAWNLELMSHHTPLHFAHHSITDSVRWQIGSCQASRQHTRTETQQQQNTSHETHLVGVFVVLLLLLLLAC
jgi:hypothetical protein